MSLTSVSALQDFPWLVTRRTSSRCLSSYGYSSYCFRIRRTACSVHGFIIICTLCPTVNKQSTDRSSSSVSTCSGPPSLSLRSRSCGCCLARARQDSSTSAAIVCFQEGQSSCLVRLLVTHLEDLLLRIWESAIVKYRW